MPPKKRISSGRKRKNVKRKTLSSGRKSHGSASRSTGRSSHSASRGRKPRRARSSSRSRGEVQPAGHGKRSRSKDKLSKDKCGPQSINKVSESMSLTQLQNIAKKKGIVFGGLTKKQLVKKICQYS